MAELHEQRVNARKDSRKQSRPFMTRGCLRNIRKGDTERPEENRAGVTVNSPKESFEEETVSG